MDKDALKEEVLQLIDYQQEGTYWDFKREWYLNTSDLFHDILCMANNPSKHDGFIIIGVDEKDYSIYDVTNDDNRKKTQDIVNILRDKEFAGGIRPIAFVQPLSLDQKEIDVIVIQSDRNVPYFLLKPYKDIYAYSIYTRVIDTNTPKNKCADINYIEKLWRKRFGIDATARERALLYLQSPSDWEDMSYDKKFYQYAPEFTIDATFEETKTGYDFYLFNQINSSPAWYNIEIFYHQTLLYFLCGISLDGGRYFTSTPKTDIIKCNSHHEDLWYKYFVKGSIEYVVHQFYAPKDTTDAKEIVARNRFLECILIFNSEQERSQFQEYVKNNYAQYDMKKFTKGLPHFLIEKSRFEKEYLHSQLLREMLNDFRKNISKGNNG